jgi:glucose/arabinose dehydrogenase
MVRTSVNVFGVLTLTAVTVSLVGCPAVGPTLPAPLNVAAGLQATYLLADTPTLSALAVAGDGDGRVFYAEKESGWIRIIKEGQLLDAPLATLPVNYAGDRGLLGLALHPRFATNGRIYVFYSRSDTGVSTSDPQAIVDHRVVYFTLAGDVAAGGEVFVASLPVGASTVRVGGCVGFAPDGTLYVGFGDTGDYNAAQAGDSLLGKILRFNDDGSLPANPTAGSAVYARGLCDPRSLAFQPETGAAFVLDRNADVLSEINRIQAGRNYGWPAVTGLADEPGELDFVAQNADYADPAAESPDLLLGATFNPSTKYGSDSRHQLFYANAAEGRIWRLAITAEGGAPEPADLFAAGFPVSLRATLFSPAGTLYVAMSDAVLAINRFP